MDVLPAPALVCLSHHPDTGLLQNILSPKAEGALWKRGGKIAREAEDQGVCCELCLPVT